MNPPDAATCARCGTGLHMDTLRDLPEPEPGLVAGAILLDRYVIERPLGRGGMAEVYAAMDRQLSRRVALKLLGADLLRHRTARKRMETEAAALGRVRHPNVIEINNVFDHDGRLVLDLELVEGGTLAARIPPGGMAVADAVHLMSSILAGLGALHRADLVHRDMKPANILLTRDGVPKIADLGVARDDAGHRPTRTGTTLGTPMYMSPEQIRPNGGSALDARADIYACGIVLYEMLTGDPPFKTDSEFDLMAMHVSVPPDLGRLHRAPPPIVTAIGVALEKDPARRWRSADDFRHALTHGASGATLGPGPVARPGSAPRAGVGLTPGCLVGIIVACGLVTLGGLALTLAATMASSTSGPAVITPADPSSDGHDPPPPTEPKRTTSPTQGATRDDVRPVQRTTPPSTATSSPTQTTDRPCSSDGHPCRTAMDFSNACYTEVVNDGRMDLAERWCNEGLERGPSSTVQPMLLYNLCLVACHQRNFLVARARCQQSLDLRENSEVRQALGMIDEQRCRR